MTKKKAKRKHRTIGRHNRPKHTLPSGFEDVIEDFRFSILGLIKAYPAVFVPALERIAKSAKEFHEYRKRTLKRVEDGYEVPGEKLAAYEKYEKAYRNDEVMMQTLPQSLVIALVSHFDFLLGKLIERTLYNKEQILKSSSKQIEVGEIMDISDLSTMKEFLVRREVESLTGGNRWDCIKWLEERLNIQFAINDERHQKLVEFAERRHLIVHSNGIVTKEYLRICKKFNAPIPEGARLGTKLGVSPEYFFESAWNIFLIGYKIAHISWRKVAPSELRDSDLDLLNTSAEFLRDRNPGIAYPLASLGTSFESHSNERNRLALIINKALALKDGKRKEEANAIIDAVDWTQKDDKELLLAVAMLREQHDEVITIMHEIGPTKQIRWAYSEWPVFREFKKTVKFKKAYKSIFKRPFVVPDDRHKGTGANI